MVAIPVEDRLALQELTSLYAFYRDTRDLEPMLDLFEDDASFDETELGLPMMTGKEALRALYANGMETRRVAHFVTNHLIRAYAADRASGICFVHAEAISTETQAPSRIYGYYDDNYVKRDGGWRFASRRLVPLLPPELNP